MKLGQLLIVFLIFILILVSIFFNKNYSDFKLDKEHIFSSLFQNDLFFFFGAAGAILVLIVLLVLSLFLKKRN